jgi:uncharacterized protein involved in exopolysaccharide biosynthesis
MEQHSSGITLREILHVLFKRKWTIILFFLSTVCTGSLLAVLTNRPVYEATAQILLKPGREHVYDLSVPTGGQVRPSVSFQIDEQAARTIALLTGRYLSEQVVATVGARELCREPFRWPLPQLVGPFCGPELDDHAVSQRVTQLVQENVHAERIPDAALVNLSFRHEDPVLAAKVVNTLTRLYVDRHLSVLKNQGAEAFVQEQVGALRGRVTEAEEALEAFKHRNGISSTVKDDREAAIRQLTALRAEHNETLSREAEVSSRITRLTSQLASIGTNPPATIASREKLGDLERKETAMALQLGDRNPALVSVREEIRRTREELLKSKDGGMFQPLQDELLRSETELTTLQARLATQSRKLAELKQTAGNLDRIEPDFDRLQQELRSEQQNYSLYATKSEETRISNAMDAEKISSVTVIEPAKPPMNAVASKFAFKIMLLVFFGVAGGLITALGLELISAELDTPERVESLLGVPVLTSIPNLLGYTMLPEHGEQN